MAALGGGSRDAGGGRGRGGGASEPNVGGIERELNGSATFAVGDHGVDDAVRISRHVPARG